MSEIEKAIVKHREKSIELKKIYMGNDKISYEKGKELQKQQDDEYKKMMFLKNLKKEMDKNGKN